MESLQQDAAKRAKEFERKVCSYPVEGGGRLGRERRGDRSLSTRREIWRVYSKMLLREPRSLRERCVVTLQWGRGECQKFVNKKRDLEGPSWAGHMLNLREAMSSFLLEKCFPR